MSGITIEDTLELIDKLTEQELDYIHISQENTTLATLSKNDQKELVILDPLWQMIMNTPGWFPV